MTHDDIIATLHKAGYQSVRTFQYDAGLAWTIVSAGGRSVRISVDAGDDTVSAIVKGLARAGLVPPSKMRAAAAA